MTKVFQDKDVYTASKERIGFLFDEFEDIYVSVSGGKDSTVVFNLVLEVARERGRRIGCFFLDQEFEYQATIDLIRKWMHEPDVDPYWVQVPIKMYNANSPTQPYVEIWSPEREDTWMRPLEPDSIREPFSKSDRFQGTWSAFVDWRQGITGRRSCGIAGLRADESFTRYIATTARITYKGVSWGRRTAHAYQFNPIYDWTFNDVWKYICDSGVEYNPVYDKYYQMGLPLSEFRVSNLIHEYTMGRARFLQELEPETYDRLTRAIPGLATTAKFEEDWIPKELPEAFVTWKEYRDYLLDNIIDPQYRQGFRDAWAGQLDDERVHRSQVTELVKSDVTHTVNKDRTYTLSRDLMKKKAREMRRKG